MLCGLGSVSAQTPLEVYAADEDDAPLSVTDELFSEFGRGLRMARRKAADLPAPEAQRFEVWLRNASQLPQHLERGSLHLVALELEELRQRDQIQRSHDLGRGEAACLALAQRTQTSAVFVSEDDEACKVAKHLGVTTVMRQELLLNWVRTARPPKAELIALIHGLERARFTLAPRDIDALLEVQRLTRWDCHE